jgi:aspartyl/asparaginyl beta-hydroxylase (cupin superfamily)
LQEAFDIASGRSSTTRPQNPSQKPTLYFPGLTTRAWHDPSAHEAVAILEKNYPTIRRELEGLFSARQGFQPFFDAYLADGGRWNAFYLRVEGHDLQRNHQLCPETTAIINSLPRIGEMALFSGLTPGTHIAAHCGPWNFRLTIHLGLIIPPGCAFRVATETRHWEEGKCLIFDDSFEHEVWNRGTATRFCLLVDVWHPDLTDTEIRVLQDASQIFATLFRLGQRVEQTKNLLDGQQWWE